MCRPDQEKMQRTHNGCFFFQVYSRLQSLLRYIWNVAIEEKMLKSLCKNCKVTSHLSLQPTSCKILGLEALKLLYCLFFPIL